MKGEFGRTLRVLREASGATQIALEGALQKSRSYLCRVENGEIPPPGRQDCLTLAWLLGTDAESLWRIAALEHLERGADGLLDWHQEQVGGAPVAPPGLLLSGEEEALIRALRARGLRPSAEDLEAACGIAEAVEGWRKGRVG